MLSARYSGITALASFSLVQATIVAARLTSSYRVLEVGGSTFQVGLVAGTYGSLSLAFALLLGTWMDRFGAEKFVVGGMLSLLAATVCNLWSPTPYSLLVSQAILGLGAVAVAVGAQSRESRYDSSSERARRLTMLSASASLGHIAGPLLAGWALDAAGPSTISGVPSTSLSFLICAGSATLALLLILPTWLTTACKAPARQPLPTSGGGMLLLLRRREIRVPLVTSLLALSTLDILMAYLPVIGLSRGLGAGLIGWLLAVRSVAGLVARLVLVRLDVGWPRNTILFLVLLGSAVALNAIALSESLVALFFAVALIGAALGLVGPVTLASIADVAPLSLRSTALGMRMAGNRLGQLTVPIALGSLASKTAPSVVFSAASVGLLFASSWVWRTQRRLSRSRSARIRGLASSRQQERVPSQSP